MRISIVTDELSNDPETAFELGLEWGVDAFELRGVYDQRIPRIEPYQRRRLIRAIRDFGVKITAVSPGLFKIPLPAEAPARSNLGWMDRRFSQAWSEARNMVADHLENLLPETIDFAGEAGASMIIAFSFERGGDRPGNTPPAAIDALARAGEAAGKAGLTLAIETEEGHWANTGHRSAALAEKINLDNAGINWDPANALIDGDLPYPDGYQAIRPFLKNVHFKDVAVDTDGSWQIVEQGGVDWTGQIAALVRDGYQGAIAIEPHLSPSVASCRRSLERLRGLISEAQNAKENFSTN